MKKIKYILLFLFIAFCITDCKKYPDGPEFSLRGKLSRITGAYRVASYKVNDIDSTSILPCNNGYYSFSAGHGESDMGGCCSGFWGLTDKNTKINITIYSGEIGPFIRLEKLTWTILRLTNKEFWMSIDYQNNHYELKLKKIEDYKP